jgi:S-formylglutathione hydrolase FrmB
MPIATIQMFSPALQRPVPLTMFLPETRDAEPMTRDAGPGPYPVLLQLHGRWDDHYSWLHKSNLRAHTGTLPLIVVMPDGGSHHWADTHTTLRYESMILEDIMPFVKRMFPVRPGPWAIGGLSMGGYGALRLGMKHPDTFCSIFAHSSVIPNQEEVREWMPWINARIAEDLDCAVWARRLDRESMPRIGFDCGVDDDLIEHNRRFHRLLEEIGVPHRYAEHPGAHTWDYWDRHVQTALRQHAEVFGIEAVNPAE